ncbi:MAG: YqeG family HAD IIIA-type phosphatase [Candidatus Margulisbacteria bacterium]|nr:YqeG family HAD IIIA-type phosphatase [Candidatus Margulisiibacteriota bacterium]
MIKINFFESMRDVLSAYLMPDEHKSTILDIDFELLHNKGFNCALIDIDNTIVERKYSFPEWKMKKLVDDLKAKKWKVILVSNNRRLTRALRVADFLEISCVYKAMKPFPWVYQKIFKDYSCLPSKTVCIGDQLFMDILGGNIVDCRTVYVDPLGPEQKLYRAVYIWIERYVLRILESIL